MTRSTRSTFRGSLKPSQQPYNDGKYEYPLGCKPPDNTNAALKREGE